jgi:hypothetical protein
MERKIMAILAIVSLSLCLIFPIVHFLGKINAAAYKSGFLLASAAWFIFATLWITSPKNRIKDK